MLAGRACSVPIDVYKRQHHRLQQVVDRLTDKDCDYISVKISAIFSQLHLVAFEETVNLIQARLRILYRAAITNAVTLPDGSRKPKFCLLYTSDVYKRQGQYV